MDDDDDDTQVYKDHGDALTIAYQSGYYDGKKAAQPAQEPVAFINAEQRTFEWAKPTSWHTPTVVNLPKIPLYTAPPQRPWVGLTDDDIKEIVGPYGDMPIKGYTRKLFDQIEAALRSKNT